MKFEMNRNTLGMIKRDGLVCNPSSLIENKYTFYDIPIVINTNKPDGIVQLGRDSIDLTYTDNIRASLESLVYAAKRREGGLLTGGMLGHEMSQRACETEELRVADVDQKKLDKLRSAFDARAKGSRGDLEAMSLYHCQAVKDWKTQNIGGMYTPTEEDIDELIRTVVEQRVETVPQKPPVSFPMVNAMYGKHCSSERASGRTFRALLDVMKTASESPEGSITLFVVADDSDVYLSYGRLTHVMGRMLGDVLNDNKAKTLTFENRTIQVVSKNKMATNMNFSGCETSKRINVVYDHTVQGGE